jgi:hypothetical protein
VPTKQRVEVPVEQEVQEECPEELTHRCLLTWLVVLVGQEQVQEAVVLHQAAVAVVVRVSKKSTKMFYIQIYHLLFWSDEAPWKRIVLGFVGQKK